MKLGQFTVDGFRPALAQGPFLIPPSFGVSADALLEPLRNEVRALYSKLPPDLQEPFTPRLAECNDRAARGEYEKATTCLKSLHADLVPVVEEYEKIPFGERKEAEEGVSPWVYGAVGAAVLTAIFTLR